MNKKVQVTKYLVSDFLAAAIGWSLFYFHQHSSFTPGKVYYAGLFIIPVFWLLLYYISGYYNDVFRKSRLAELWQSLGNCFIGMVILYLVLDSKPLPVFTRNTWFLAYFAIHFLVTYIPRVAITTATTHKVHKGELGFNTLLIGSNARAVEVWQDMKNQKRQSGNKFIGFVDVDNGTQPVLAEHLPHLGTLERIKTIIADYRVQEVIIAIESSEFNKINRIINMLIDTNVVIKAIPSMYDILTGKVRMNAILGTPLILVSHRLMPAWQENVKNVLDFTVSFIALAVTLPLSIVLAAGIKISSKGPVLYSHERIGRYGKPFTIYKFRSMYHGAEKNGPELSSRNDDRITPFGRFMRKLRIDEIPNFYNVLKGDMSLVGPRPERKYFIDLIVEKEPHYLHLLKVKPGITSWGQVRYGYAENVEQMVERVKYDLIYLDNMSLYVDFKILIYTVLTIVKRKGI